MSRAVLVADNITKYFGKKCVLKDVSFTVYEGDLIGLVGINGAGKTTLFKCLTGLLQCDGRIEAYGYSLSDREKFLRDVLFIFDKSTCFEEMSGYDILKDFSAFYGKYTQKDIYKALYDVGLNGAEKLKVKKYSLGMKQRLNIAKILIAKPKIVLMDEPFNGIDIDGVDSLISIIKRLNKDENTVFIVSSHQVNELEKFANRILGISDSRLVIDRYADEQKKILVGIKLSRETDLEKIKEKYQYKYTRNEVHYFEYDSDSAEKFINYVNDNGIRYTYFDTNNAVKQEIYDLLGGENE